MRHINRTNQKVLELSPQTIQHLIGLRMRQIVFFVLIFVVLMSAVAGNPREKRWWGYCRWYRRVLRVKNELIANLTCTVEDLQSQLNSTQFTISSLQTDLADCQANQGNSDPCECPILEHLLIDVAGLTVTPTETTDGTVTLSCSGKQFVAECINFQWTMEINGVDISKTINLITAIQDECASPFRK